MPFFQFEILSPNGWVNVPSKALLILVKNIHSPIQTTNVLMFKLELVKDAEEELDYCRRQPLKMRRIGTIQSALQASVCERLTAESSWFLSK